MKRLLVATAVLAVTVLPSFAADGGTPDTGVPANPGMKQMMRNPHHLLAMAYHKNVITFGRALARVAEQGDTVPTEFARTAIAEMRRSTDQMEKHRAQALAAMPADMRGQMQKQTDEHLANVKTQLRQLEDLAKRDRIPSKELLGHLQPLLMACSGTQCELPRRGMHNRGMGGKGRGGAGCPECEQMAGPEHQQMMQDMTQKLKEQDAQMVQLVEKMKRAPRDKKIDLMSDILARIVQQRADMTVQMEKMQKRMMNGSVPPPPPGNWDDDDADDDTVGGE